MCTCVAAQVKQYESDKEKTMIEHPDMNTFVFCRALTDCGNLAVGEDGETVEMKEGDLHVINYKYISSHVRSGQVGLL